MNMNKLQYFRIDIFDIITNISIVQSQNIIQISISVVEFIYQVMFSWIFIDFCHELRFIPVQEQVGDERSTVCSHRNTNNLSINYVSEAYVNIVEQEF